MGDNLYYPYVYYHYPEPQPIAEIVMKGDEDVNTAQTPCFDDSANMASYYSYPYDSVNAESNLKDMPLEAMSGYSQYQQPEYPPVPHLGHLPLSVDPSLDQNHLPSPQTDNEYSFDDTVPTEDAKEAIFFQKTPIDDDLDSSTSDDSCISDELPTTNVKSKPGISARNLKVDGEGRSVAPKKVTPDMDSDDELLWNLKLANWTEKDIHARLVKEKRAKWSLKTIGTRFGRMKKIMKRHVDHLLKTGDEDWHYGDDEALRLAIEKANNKIIKYQQNIERTKWKLVSNYLKEMKPVTNYSGKACRDRYIAHITGTAAIPLELRPQLSEQELAAIERRRVQEEKIREFERIPRG